MLAGMVNAILPFHFGIEKVAQGFGALGGRQKFGVLQNHQRMEIIADPEIVGVAKIGGRALFFDAYGASSAFA